MRVSLLTVVAAAIIGFVAVYASLTLSGNGEKRSDAVIKQKTAQDHTDRLKSFIFHEAPKPLENFEFQDQLGNTKSLSDWKGKLVLLNLWATWCGPCREEMPSLDNLKKFFAKEPFDVVAISMDRSGLSKPRKFYDEERLKHLDLYIDQTTKLMFKLKAVGLPATILIDKEGREIGRLAGPAQWDSDLAIDMIKKALKK